MINSEIENYLSLLHRRAMGSYEKALHARDKRDKYFETHLKEAFKLEKEQEGLC